MKKRPVILGMLLLLFISSALAAYRSVPYSSKVLFATQSQKDIPDDPVYIGPDAWIRKRGAYPLVRNRTIGALVESAGGFTKDERVKGNPTRYIYPDLVRVFRPTKDSPDPTEPTFVYSLDWSRPNGGISNCAFALQSKDCVDVRPKWTLDERDSTHQNREQGPERDSVPAAR